LVVIDVKNLSSDG